jgi:hypothetical protein
VRAFILTLVTLVLSLIHEVRLELFQRCTRCRRTGHVGRCLYPAFHGHRTHNGGRARR